MLIIKCDFCENTQRTMTMYECREISYDGTAFGGGEHYHICQECLRRLAKGGDAHETAQTN